MEQDMKSKEELFLDAPTTDDFNSPQYSIFLDQLFTLGSIPEQTYTIFEGLRVTLRVLLPIENLEISKRVDAAPGFYSKELLIKIETLARAIVKVNGQYLRFSDSMINEWKQFRNTTDNPTEVEQQRFILQYRFKQMVIEECHKKYQELLKKQEEILSGLKKN